MLALIRNGLVLIVMYRLKKFVNTYQLIASQCFSDAVFGIVFLCKFYLCSRSIMKTQLGLIACDALLTIDASTVAVSSLTFGVIAFDRYLTLYHPNQLRMRENICIPSVLSLTLLLAVLNNLNSEDLEFFTPDRLISCRITMETDIPFFKKRYQFILIKLVGLFDSYIICFSYWMVFCKINQRNAVGVKNDAQIATVEKTKKRTINILITMTTFFKVLNAPIYYSLMLEVLYPKMHSCHEVAPSTLFLARQFLCALSSIVNPFVLFYFNLELRADFGEIMSQVINVFFNGHAIENT